MPRGIDSSILTVLNGTIIADGFFYLFDLELRSGTVYWDRRAITYAAHPSGSSKTYEPRIFDCSAISFTPGDTQEVTLTIDNTDGAISTINQTESTYGCKVTIRQFVPAANAAHVVFVGYLDDITELGPVTATFTIHANVPGMHSMLPRRQVGLTCPHEFGTPTTDARYVSTSEFDGAECRYQGGASLTGGVITTPSARGFYGTLPGNITNNATLIDVTIPSGFHTDGMRFKVSDEITIDSERMYVSAVTGPTGTTYTLTVVRGWRSTAPASHTNGTNVFFASCQKSTQACMCRGMYGNNTADTFSSRARNYFGGFPLITGYTNTQLVTFAPKGFSQAKPHRASFAGNDSAYGQTLPLVYGRARIADPILLIARNDDDQANYISSLWAICEGPLATNASDASQTTPANAYLPDPNPPKGYEGQQYLRVNGILRHDTRDGYALQISNGLLDTIEPGTAYFPNVSDFTTNKLAFWGTAWAAIKIDIKNHPEADPKSGSMSAAMGLRYGRLVRVYTDTSTYTTKAAGGNAAWALMDVMATRRPGAGAGYASLHIQSFLDAAAYNVANVTNTVHGGNVARWTFNGVISGQRSYDEQVAQLCLAMQTTRPFRDAAGLFRIQSLKALSGGELAAVPVFTDKDSSSRNILWEDGPEGLTTLRGFHRHRQNEVPNRIRATYVESGEAWGYLVNHGGGYAAATTTVAIDSGAGQFRAGELVTFTGVRGSYLIQSSVGGSSATSITFTPGLADAVADNAVIGYASAFGKVEFVLDDEASQNLVSGQRNVVEKSIDLVGCSSLDEAARKATLIARIGEFGEGGLSNNFGVRFRTSVKHSQNCEVGDVIAVESNQLDAVDQRYFRITRIDDDPQVLPTGALVFIRTIEAMQHDNSFYDDTAYTITSMTPIEPNTALNAPPPPVTSFTVTEAGIVNANGTAQSRLTFNYTEPVPLANFRSVVIMRSNDDGSGNPVGDSTTNGDWRLVTECTRTGTTFDYDVTGTRVHFAAVSRPLGGHLPNVNTKLADGSYKYPRFSVIVDGMVDTLPAPSGLQAFGRLKSVYLTWSAYTGTDKKLCKRYKVYRGTTSDPAASSLIGESDTTWFKDESDTIAAAPSTTFYYFVRGVSILEGAVINGVTQDGLSTYSSAASDNPGTDAAAPNAPVVGVVRNIAGEVLSSDYNVIVGVEPPGSPTNYDTVESWQLQIALGDNTFATGVVLDEVIQTKLPNILPVTLRAAGTYYFRARAINIFGNGAYSSILSHATDSTAGATDTDVPPVPVGLALATASAANPIAGNAYQVQFRYPATQVASAWGYYAFIHDSTSLPTTTKAETERTNGILTAGSNRLTLASGTPWTASQWVSPDAHDIIIFSPKRPGTPQWELDSMVYHTKITGNGTNYIDFDFEATRQKHNWTGLTFWIVKSGVGDHFYEKLKGARGDVVDFLKSSQKRETFSSQITTAYGYAAVHNLWGLGKLAGPTSSAAIAGLVTAEIKDAAITTAKIGDLQVTTGKIVNAAIEEVKLATAAVTETKIATDAVTSPKIIADAVITTKIAALNVTAAKISVSSLSAINADMGTITAGTVTGATIRTAASGQRIDINSTNGLRAFDSGGSLNVQIPVSGETGIFFGGTTSGSGTGVFGTSTSVDFYIGGTEYAAVTNQGFTTVGSGKYQVGGTTVIDASRNITGVTITASSGFSGSGASLTNLSASAINSGTLNASHLPATALTTSSNLNASNLTSGTVDPARLPANLNISTVTIDGSTYEIQFDVADLGTGTKTYLYVT